MAIPKTHYELLGVPHSADAQALHMAFRRLTKTLHPDTTVLPSEEAAIKFQQVCEAYELLSDPILREGYDQRLNQETLQNTPHALGSYLPTRPSSKAVRGAEVRRPLSGGELFSLLLLGFALLMSLLLGIVFASFNGRELQVRPSWLIVNYEPINLSIFPRKSDKQITSSSYAFKPTLISCH